MHVSLVVGDNTSTNYGGSPKFTHVIYAYSPDGGNTFRKADGTPISALPITLNNADVVAGPAFAKSIGFFSYTSAIGLASDGNPMVMIPTEGSTNYLSIWSPSAGWSAPRAMTTSYRAQLVTDGDGVLTSVSNGLVRSFDGMQTSRTYAEIDARGGFTPFDHFHLRQTNQIRFANLTSDNTLRVWTVEFSGTGPPPPKARASNNAIVP